MRTVRCQVCGEPAVRVTHGRLDYHKNADGRMGVICPGSGDRAADHAASALDAWLVRHPVVFLCALTAVVGGTILLLASLY